MAATYLAYTRRFPAVAAALLILSLNLVPEGARAADSEPASRLLKEIELLPADDLVIDRTNCALGKMPEVLARMRASRIVKGELPSADTYCQKVLSVTRIQNRGADLYIRLALLEQGITSGFSHSGMAKYLANDEAGRTFNAVLTAANSGAARYASITGKTHALPCPLALDAGMTWASGNAKAQLPVSLTDAEVSTITRQCYDPTVTQITVSGKTIPAQKAGLIAGIWLAKH